MVQMESKAIQQLSEISDFKPEYLEIVDGHTLQPIEKMEKINKILAKVDVQISREVVETSIYD